MPPAVEAQSPNHWTPGDSLTVLVIDFFFSCAGSLLLCEGFL